MSLLSSPPLRDWYMRMLRTAGWLLLINCALILGTRRMGYRLDEWIAPTLFITLFGIAMPKHPSPSSWRPLHQRIAVSLLLGAISGVFLWALMRS